MSAQHHNGRSDRPVADATEVASIAEALRDAGSFALDLEFMTEGRYVPELSLVQVAWGDPAGPAVAAIDPLAVDVRAVMELVADESIETVIHAAQADLSLIGALFDVRGRSIYDTQIAGAFVGMGDQVGYANLIERLLDISLDKGAQFTEWSRRPLSDEQLSYALDDVRYLLAAWELIRGRLEDRDRLAWVREECERMAAVWADRVPPEEMYRRVRGWNGLKPAAQGALRALAGWRERESLRANRPPSFLMNDRSLLEIARRRPRDEAALRDVRGLGAGTVQRHGRAILRWVEEGSADPPDAPPRAPNLPPQGQGWPALLGGIIAARSRESGIAPRFVAPRREIEELTEWWLVGDRDVEPDIPMLHGWRRELAGQEVMDWLAGKSAIAVDSDSGAGIRVVRLAED